MNVLQTNKNIKGILNYTKININDLLFLTIKSLSLISVVVEIASSTTCLFFNSNPFFENNGFDEVSMKRVNEEKCSFMLLATNLIPK